MRRRHPTRSHHRVAPLALLVLIAMFSMGAKRCEHPRGCFQDGKRHEVGTSFPSSDGCNTCRCEADGTIACTLRACLPPDSCGGASCGDDEYCAVPAEAACNPLAGQCEQRPSICTAIYDPVCGCDGQTYGNECEAAGEGVAVASKGECATSCGGLLGAPCPDGEYCSYAPEALCGAADATGTCQEIPEACADIYQPVCGCDDQTYGNACEAAAAGVSVVSEGECDASSGTGTCTMGDAEFEAGESVICEDGCNQCTCEGDDRWTSTLIYCEPASIERCEGPPASDVNVTPLYRSGDALALTVQYAGGCFPHTFKLCYDGAFRESIPVQTSIWVVDTTEEVDGCLALPTVERVWDLGPLRELYTEQYPNGPSTLLLKVGRSQVEYSF